MTRNQVQVHDSHTKSVNYCSDSYGTTDFYGLFIIHEAVGLSISNIPNHTSRKCDSEPHRRIAFRNLGTCHGYPLHTNLKSVAERSFVAVPCAFNGSTMTTPTLDRVWQLFSLNLPTRREEGKIP